MMWTTGGSDWSEMGGERDEAMVLMMVQGSKACREEAWFNQPRSGSDEILI